MTCLVEGTDFPQLPGATTTAASFEFTNEDHTLGNALRHVIMKEYVFRAGDLWA